MLQKLKEDVENYRMPDEMSEEADKSLELVGRYSLLMASLADNLAKAETLCVCWNKLNADMSELTVALRYGGNPNLIRASMR